MTVPMGFRPRTWGLAFLLIGSLGRTDDGVARLGDAPRIRDPRQLAPGLQGTPSATAAIDTTNRQAVIDAYRNLFLPALAVPNDWNGNVASCTAGSTSAAYASATFQMVDYFRGMAGLGTPMGRNATKDAKDQRAALMMHANGQLSHTPPTSFLCYTADGAEAAGSSNLAGGGPTAAGASAITLYVQDYGSSNTALGHRRWILYPRQTEMGTGSTSAYNALWVIGAFGARPASPGFVAWPPAGFVPYPTTYPRWSFSLNSNSSVDFSAATVAMTRSGSPVGLTVLPVEVGYGDPTIGWEPSGIVTGPGMADQTYVVTVSNVKVNGTPTQFTYTVTIIDPNPPSIGGINPNGGSIAGGTSITVTGTNFTAPASLTLGGAAATSVTVVNPNTVTALTPPHAAGVVDVALTVPSAPAALLPAGFFYYAPPPPSRFYTLTPCRLLDTRGGSGAPLGPPALPAGGRRNLAVSGLCGIPTSARALSVNVTVTGGTNAGFVTLFPGDAIKPATSNSNFASGQTRANNAIVLLATNGTGLIAAVNGSAGSVHLILDVNGYFQ